MQWEYKIAVSIAVCVVGIYFSTSLFSFKVKLDENIIFYPTVAVYSQTDKRWHVDIHAQVLETEDDSIIRNAFLGYLKDKLDLEKPEESVILKSRLRYFLADNQRWKSITVKIGSDSFVLNNTKANGHVSQTLKFTDKKFKNLAGDGFAKSILPVHAKMPKKDSREFEGVIHIVKNSETILVSDIDDTIKISDVRNKKALLRNTFVEKFKPVPGMALLYEKFHASKTHICYVSASPWQLYTDLNAFVKQEGFPDGVFAMKYFRAKDTDFFNLFESPDTYKIETISTIMKQSPDSRFILVGDNGEKDPEAYGEIARKYPGRVLKILIREAYPEKNTGRYKNAFKNLPEDVVELFTDASKIDFKIK